MTIFDHLRWVYYIVHCFQYLSLYKEILHCIARASHDVVSWRCVRERDRDRFGAKKE